jgi:Cytochrome c
MTRSLAMMFACGLWVAVPVVLVVGCGDDSDDHGSPDDHNDDHDAEHGDHEHEPVGPPSGATCPDGDSSTLTYENFGKEFFSKYCTSCHSSKVKGDARMKAPADHNFDTYEEIELLSEHIDQKAAAGTKTNVSMPPTDPKPTLEERKKLGEWIACGLKE